MCNNKTNLNKSNTLDKNITKNKFNNLNKDTKYLLAIIIFSISFLISTIILGNSVKFLGYSYYDGLTRISNNISYLSSNLNYPSSSNDTKNDTVSSNKNVTVSQHTLSIQDAATYLGIAPDELWKVVNDPDSKIPYFKVGQNRCFFTKEGLDKWLEGNYTLNFDVN